MWGGVFRLSAHTDSDYAHWWRCFACPTCFYVERVQSVPSDAWCAQMHAPNTPIKIKYTKYKINATEKVKFVPILLNLRIWIDCHNLVFNWNYCKEDFGLIKKILFPRCIFSSQKLGTWQYLADIPFATISPRMLWRIFYTLHLDYQEESHGDFGGQVYNSYFCWIYEDTSSGRGFSFQKSKMCTKCT